VTEFEKLRFLATSKSRQWRCRRDMLQQTVPNTRTGDRKSMVTDVDRCVWQM